MMRKYKLVDRDIENMRHASGHYYDEFAIYCYGMQSYDPHADIRSIYYCCGVIASGKKLHPYTLEKHNWCVNILVRYCPSLDSFRQLVPYLQKHQHRHKTYIIKRPIPEILDFAEENGIILCGDPESKYSLVIAGREPDDDPTFYYAYADVAAQNGQWDKFYDYYNRLGVNQHRGEIVGHLIERGDKENLKKVSNGWNEYFLEGHFFENIRKAPRETVKWMVSNGVYSTRFIFKASEYTNPDFCRYYFDIPDLQPIFKPRNSSLPHLIFDEKLHFLVNRMRRAGAIYTGSKMGYYWEVYDARHPIAFNRDFFMYFWAPYNYRYLKNFLLNVSDPDDVKIMVKYVPGYDWKPIMKYIEKINPEQHAFISQSI